MELISREQVIATIDSFNVFESRSDQIKLELMIGELPIAGVSTNLAEVGTDCISKQQAIDALRGYLVGKRCPDDGTLTCRLIENEVINKLPSAQPDIVRCRDCRYYNHEEKECLDLLGYGRRWEEDDYCSYGAKMEVNNENN